MQIITHKIKGDVTISENTELLGMIVGNVRVIDSIFELDGTVVGNLILEENCIVNLHGTVNGHVINQGGDLKVFGVINGTLQEIAGQTWIDTSAIINRK